MPKRPSTISAPRQRAGHVRQRCAAAIDERPVRVRGVGGHLRHLAREDDGDVEKALAQPPRDDERITAVVAGARKDEDGAAAVADHRHARRRQPPGPRAPSAAGPARPPPAGECPSLEKSVIGPLN
jgi:hypothetical protein